MSAALVLLAPLSASVLGAGCVVPLPYEYEGSDAGPQDYPPIITGSVPSMPGPHVLDEVQRATPFTIEVTDHDLGDTICAKVFRDYEATNALPALSSRCVPNDPVNGKEERTIELQPTTWCNLTTEGTHSFSVVVADTQFIDDDLEVERPYQEIAPGGERTYGFWTLSCPPETSGT